MNNILGKISVYKFHYILLVLTWLLFFIFKIHLKWQFDYDIISTVGQIHQYNLCYCITFYCNLSTLRTFLMYLQLWFIRYYRVKSVRINFLFIFLIYPIFFVMLGLDHSQIAYSLGFCKSKETLIGLVSSFPSIFAES